VLEVLGKSKRFTTFAHPNRKRGGGLNWSLAGKAREKERLEREATKE